MPGFLLLLPFTAFIELGCVLAINKCKELLDQDQQRAQQQQQQQQRLVVTETPANEHPADDISRQPYPFTRSSSLRTSLFTIPEAENEDGEISEDSELVQTPSRSQTHERRRERRRRRSRESATNETVQAAVEDDQYMPSSPASHYTTRPLSESDHKNMPVISLPYPAQQQHPHAAGGYYYYPASAPQQHYHDQQLLAYQQQHYHHYQHHQMMMAAHQQQQYHQYYQQQQSRRTSMRTVARE